MTIFPNPYDPQYPAGWFHSMTVTVDPSGTNGDSSLGGGWASFSLVVYTQTWEFIKAAGFSPRYFRKNASESWPAATLSRPWTPLGSAQIANWMKNCKDQGPCTLTIEVDVSAGYRTGTTSVSFIFYNVVPTTWSAPTYSMPGSTAYAEGASESIQFEYNAYDITTTPATGPQFTSTATAAPQAKLRILLGGAKAADPLAALTAWIRTGTVMGAGTAAGADAVEGLSGFDPAINFWLPPERIKIDKGSAWSISSTPSADGSGPAEWKGTDPMKLSFDYVLTSLASETNQVRNSSNSSKPGGSTFNDKSSWGYDLAEANKQSIQNQINQLFSLLEADQSISLVTGLRMPPLVMFEFGTFISPVSYVSKVDMTIEKFNSNGDPTRAAGSITITQYPVPEALQNPTSGGIAAEDQALLYDGDSLPHVAYRYYRQPSRWRDLAAANGIDDPLRLTVGRRVSVPPAAALPARTEGGVERISRRPRRS